MNRVREVRKKLKLRLIDLAKKADVSMTWLWYVENGYDKRVSKEMKERLVEALECEYGTLFPDEVENIEETQNGRG